MNDLAFLRIAEIREKLRELEEMRDALESNRYGFLGSEFKKPILEDIDLKEARLKQEEADAMP